MHVINVCIHFFDGPCRWLCNCDRGFRYCNTSNDLVRIGCAVENRLRNVSPFFFLFVSQSLGFLVTQLLLLLLESQTVSQFANQSLSSLNFYTKIVGLVIFLAGYLLCYCFLS